MSLSPPLSIVTSVKGSIIVSSRSARGRREQRGSTRVFRTIVFSAKFFRAVLHEFCDIPAVRINCDGLVDERIAPRFEATVVQSSDFLHGYDWERAAIMTEHTGVRLVATSGSVDQDVLHKRISRNRLNKSNSVLKLLSILCNTSEHRFGLYRRSKDTGNVIVTRVDRQPLTVNYLRTLCDWIEAKLRPMFQKASTDCLKLERHYLNNLRTGTDPAFAMKNIRRSVSKQISRRHLLVWSRTRLNNEMTVDSHVMDVPDNNDLTDDEMPYDYEN
ncbi:hypothetical protein AUEXF2481DRAFT_3211 [Aureobasidium subglaciale EXF-2481]|uniref:Uncharacterized protein n=1 Tax=Aureobasidium subglaciale (strain EXF-2481) TaxID=1043005 RepID=A0A074YMR3_AURSE|nr:uncharacterized protein AUEXF2481DRAFT_3211 [Aureobasidium subglaciale EXF-2481]KEQ97394.1 hypothetical protein AUEXF2481DRAFT_3211 [Aureobasidium subglaciale EXF-2481]